MARRRNLHSLPETGVSCDRWDASKVAAIDIVNTYLMEMGILTPESMSTTAVDKSKLDRERKDGSKQIQQGDKEMTLKCVTGIYYNGKKNSTVTRVQKVKSLTPK